MLVCTTEDPNTGHGQDEVFERETLGEKWGKLFRECDQKPGKDQ